MEEIKLNEQVTIFEELKSTGLSGCDYLDNPKVNLSTGRLLYGVPDISMGINSFEISAAHVYSSDMSDGAKTLFSKYGNGWKLTLDQYLISDPTSIIYYKYVDQWGGVHTFALLDSSTKRYYDVNDSSLIMQVTQSGADLKDSLNNIIHFNADGRIEYTQSGINSNIKKQFVYENGNLVKIYDTRKPQDFLQFTYSNGLLNTIAKYRSNSKLETITFHYDASKNLISTEVTVGNSTKTRNAFTYDSNNLLTQVKTPETNDAVQITYDGGKAKRISNGKVSGNSFQTVTYTELQPLGNNQRLVKNKNDIYNLIQWDNDGNIVSSFEQDLTGRIRTWERGCGKRVIFSNPSTSETINWRETAVVDIDSKYSEIAKVNFNNFSGDNKCFQCSFYLKLSDYSDDDLFKLILRVGTQDFPVQVNARAAGVWQKVVVPIQFDSVAKGEFTFSVQIVDRRQSRKSATIAEMFVKPSAIQVNYIDGKKITDYLFGVNSEYFLVQPANGQTSYVNSRGINMTESDIVYAMLHPVATAGGFELIFDGGKHRTANIISMCMGSSTVNLLAGNTKIQTKVFAATGDEVSTTTYSSQKVNGKLQYKAVNEKNNTYSVTDEFGNLIEKTDSYGIKYNTDKTMKTATRYEYNENGNLKKVILTGNDNTELVLAEYEEENGNTFRELSEDSGLECIYNNHDLLETSQRIWYNGSTKSIFGKATYGYNEFADSLKSARFTNVTVVQNNVDYPQADKFTLSDGKCAYYIKKDAVNGRSEFGYSTDSGDRPILMQGQLNNSSLSEYYLKNNTVDSLYAEYDRYGNVLSIYYNDYVKPEVSFQYATCMESEINRLPINIYDNFSGETTQYEYDDNYNLKRWYRSGIDVTTGEDGSKTYIYSAGGNKDTYRSTKNTGFLSNYLNGTEVDPVSHEYFYDDFGRVKYKRSKYWLMNYKYDGLRCTGFEYDSSPTNSTGSFHRLDVYEYDKLGGIMGVTQKEYQISTGRYEVTNNVSYECDAYSRLFVETNTLLGIERVYTYDDSGRITRFGRNSCTYNEKGQLTKFDSKTYTYDDCGNRLTSGNEKYEWMRGKLLCRYKSEAGTSTEYRYDYHGIRSMKLVSNSKPIIYYYEGNKLLGEYENAANGVKTWYFYDESGICGMRRDGKVYNFVRNPLGDVIAITDGMTLVAKYEYDAWGNHKVYNPNGTENTSSTFIGNINPIRYRGYYYDVESGLYYLLTRYYDPSIGQFISLDHPKYLDPTSLTGLNLYAYCGNNPMKRSFIYGSTSATYGGQTIMPNSNGGNYGSIGGLPMPFANVVTMSNCSTPLIDSVIFKAIGNISFTETIQNNEAGVFYRFLNIGSTNSAGGGFNINNWFGISVYGSDNIGFGSSIQISPYFTYSGEASLFDGLSISFGIISGNITNEVTINIGWGSVALYAIATGICALPVPGARAVGTVMALLVLFIDIFK